MSRVPTLETARLTLRGWRDDDLDALWALCTDTDLRFMFGGEPLTRDGGADVLERRRSHWRRLGFGFWAAELRETGALAGWIGLQTIEHVPEIMPAVEIGWLLARPLWSRGLATEGARRALRFGFEELGLERVYAYHHPDNRRSERVMERLGMRFVLDSPDPRDGSTNRVRVLERERWLTEGERPAEAVGLEYTGRAE